MANTPEVRDTRILIVDDCCDTARMLCDLLSVKGYENGSWTTDEGALVCLCPGHEYGLVLLDMHMPAISGIELLHRLRFTQPESRVPVIAMSGDQRYRTVAIQAGASAFLLKPFDHNEVEAAISNVLFIHHGCFAKSATDVAIGSRL